MPFLSAREEAAMSCSRHHHRLAFALLTVVSGFIAFCATGCIMHRTVKNGNEVVSQGYVVKAPIIAP